MRDRSRRANHQSDLEPRCRARNWYRGPCLFLDRRRGPEKHQGTPLRAEIRPRSDLGNLSDATVEKFDRSDVRLRQATHETDNAPAFEGMLEVTRNHPK